jgi:hypothetical protein
MSDGRKVLFLSCLLLAAQQHAAAADTVTYTTPSMISSALPYDLSITPSITGADELVSINNGTISGAEFAGYQITALFSDATSQLLYTGETNSSATDTLNRTYDASFPEDTLTGLQFSATSVDKPLSLSIPAETVFTFDAVAMPEPSTVAILGTALAAVPLLRLRRRTKPARG